MTEFAWCKLFHDFADDVKFLRAAEIAGTTVELAQACFARAMCRASSDPNRGSLASVDFEEFAWWYKKPVEVIRSLFEAFEKVGRMIKDGHLANWAKRQGVAAAKLAPAAAKHRHRMQRWRDQCGLSASQWAELREQIFDRDDRKCVKCGSDEYLHCDHVAELVDGGTSDPANLQTLCRSCHSIKTSRVRVRAAERPDPRQREMMFTITPSQPASPSAGDKDSESDLTLSEESDARARARRSFASGDFEKFWEKYPHKVDQTLARAAFAAAVRDGTGLEEILTGLRRYGAAKPADREWMNPANFLKRKRWLDQPADASATIAPVLRDRPSPEFLAEVAQWTRFDEQGVGAAAS
jgi:5-methylcytosine-specific restriction protein A